MNISENEVVADIPSPECNTAVTQFSTFFRRDKKLSQFVVFCYMKLLIRRI